jgi:alpha-mannosidase
MPLEVFKLKLVDLIDRCLDILDKEPNYIFHLDAQTIVLEDYLTIRPEKRQKLIEYITKGCLVVDPWYLQNDFYLSLAL